MDAKVKEEVEKRIKEALKKRTSDELEVRIQKEVNAKLDKMFEDKAKYETKGLDKELADQQNSFL